MTPLANQIVNPSIPPWITEYIGLPYLPGGKDRNGIDCWGLFSLVWNERLGGIPAYDGAYYDGPETCSQVAREAIAFAKRFEEVPIGQERFGDGIMIRMRGLPLHVGMIIQRGLMLHIEEGANSVVEEYLNQRWEKRIIGIYRHERVPA